MTLREYYQICLLGDGLWAVALALLCAAALVWWRSRKAPVAGVLAAAAVCALAYATWRPAEAAGLLGLLVPSWGTAASAYVDRSWSGLCGVGVALNAASGLLGLIGAVWLLVAMLRCRDAGGRAPSIG